MEASLGRYSTALVRLRSDFSFTSLVSHYVFRESLERHDRLKYSSMKINLYKAVASPMYLFQTSNDPILRAFQLTGELQASARMFPQFKKEYEELWKQLKTFTAQLIGNFTFCDYGLRSVS